MSGFYHYIIPDRQVWRGLGSAPFYPIPGSSDIDNHRVAIVALYLYRIGNPERLRDCRCRSWRCLIST
jgi:hypothetical protein